VEGKLVEALLGDPVSCYKYRNLFEYSGYDWQDFAHRDRNNIEKTAGVSAVTYLRVDQWLQKRHEKAMKTYLSVG